MGFEKAAMNQPRDLESQPREVLPRPDARMQKGAREGVGRQVGEGSGAGAGGQACSVGFPLVVGAKHLGERMKQFLNTEMRRRWLHSEVMGGQQVAAVVPKGMQSYKLC